MSEDSNPGSVVSDFYVNCATTSVLVSLPIATQSGLIGAECRQWIFLSLGTSSL